MTDPFGEGDEAVVPSIIAGLLMSIVGMVLGVIIGRFVTQKALVHSGNHA